MKSSFIGVMVLSTLLSSSVLAFEPKPGMTMKQVGDMARRSCGITSEFLTANGTVSLVLVGVLSEDNDVIVMKASDRKLPDSDPCSADLYFSRSKGLLMSKAAVDQIVQSVREHEIKQKARAELKEIEVKKEEERRREDEEQKRNEYEKLKKQRGVNDDYIAQVLNFSMGCPDEGCVDAYYYKSKSNSCVYFLEIDFASVERRIMEGVLQVRMDRKTTFGTYSPKEIDFNVIDPRSIKFNIKYDEPLDIGSSRMRFPYQTEITQDGKLLFQVIGRLDVDRMQRGWSGIFKDHCKGRLRKF